MERTSSPNLAWLSHVKNKQMCVMATLLPAEKEDLKEVTSLQTIGLARLFISSHNVIIGDLGHDAIPVAKHAVAEIIAVKNGLNGGFLQGNYAIH